MSESEIFIYYAWFWWGMYIWNLNMQSYLTAIGNIIECGISNNVTNSMFLQKEYIDDVLGTVRA